MATGKHDPRYDLALMVLENPITDVAPIPLGPDIGDHVALVGYHFLTPHLPSGRLDCPVHQRRDKTLFLGCPVTSGNSGGPVLEADGNGGWRVTGVVSSRFAGGAIATRIPDWVHEVLELLE